MNKGDYFLVVQTFEAGRPVLTEVPHQWVCGNELFWPNKKADALRRNAASKPGPNWSKMPCSIKRKYIPTFSEAQQEAADLSGQSTDTSDFAPKRKKKAKQDQVRKEYDFNHLLANIPSGSQQIQSPDTSNANSNPSSVMTVNELLTQPLETVFCQPDLSQLLPSTQGFELEPLQSVISTPVETTATPRISNNEVVEQQNAVVTDGYVVNIQQPDGDRIVNETCHKIDEACERIIQEVPGIILNMVERMLVSTAASLEVKLRAAIQANPMNQYQEEVTSSFQFSPVTSVDEIKALEENLKDELFAKRLVIYMKKQIGQSGDNCNGQNVCYELIDHFFHRKVLLLCSWSGGSKGGTQKFPMKDCENIMNIFFKIVHSVNITFSRKLLEEFFKKITRNSKKRSEAKGLRQSSIHRRTKRKAIADCGNSVAQASTNEGNDVQDAQAVTAYHIAQRGQTKNVTPEHSDEDYDDDVEEEEDVEKEDDSEEDFESV